jgi:hypothetical protein
LRGLYTIVSLRGPRGGGGGGGGGGNGEAQHLLVIFNFIVHREN